MVIFPSFSLSTAVCWQLECERVVNPVLNTVDFISKLDYSVPTMAVSVCHTMLAYIAYS